MCWVYTSSVCRHCQPLPGFPSLVSLTVFSVLFTKKDFHVFLLNLLGKGKIGEELTFQCLFWSHAGDIYSCWHWLLYQAIHIFVGAIWNWRKKKGKLGLRCRWEDSKQERHWQQLCTGGGWIATAVSFNKSGREGRMREMDLRFWEIHRLGPYLIVQSQYVLVNKWALQVAQRKDSKNTRKVHWIRVAEKICIPKDNQGK